MGGPQPTAAGTLQATPMQHLLVYALDRKLQGSIVLETPQGERSAFAVDDGVPSRAKTAQPVIHLGRLLLEMGAIDEATLNRSLVRVAKEKKLHGQVLLEDGALDEKTLEAALREQVARKILWMGTLPPDTMYGYYEGVNFLERWGSGPTPVEALALIWRAVRSYETPQRIEATLSRLPKSALKLHPDAQPSRFRFGQREEVVIDLLRVKPQTVAELLDSEVADEAAVKRVLYALAISRHLDLGGSAKPIGVAAFAPREGGDTARAPLRKARRFTTGARGQRLKTPPSQPSAEPQEEERAPSSPTASSPAAAAESPDVSAMRREILDRAKHIPNENYYQILGVPMDAQTSAIQAAFFQLAKRWHPDRLGPDLSDLREVAMRTFARMNEAHQMLTDEERRAEYDELLKEGGGGTPEEQDQVQAVVRAIMSYQKAEVLLKKRNLAEAEELARSAVEADPTQADYQALLAWIIAQKPERATGPVDDLIRMLDVAVRKEPANERARFYRAQLLKRAGRAEDAIRDFRWIVEHNPKNLDAVREMRLYEMRKSQAPEQKGQSGDKKPQGGLFGKLFKR